MPSLYLGAYSAISKHKMNKKYIVLLILKTLAVLLL